MGCFRGLAACLALATVAAILWHGSAAAEPISYTEQVVASGSLGALNFTDALLTISLAADTANVMQPQSGLFTNTGAVTLSIGPATTASFINPMEVFAFLGANGAEVGIADPNAALDLLDTALPDGVFYDLTTTLGPLTGVSAINPYFPFATSAGDLDLSSVGDATFSASSPTQEVPEPASLALFGSAISLSLLRYRARKRLTAPLR